MKTPLHDFCITQPVLNASNISLIFRTMRIGLFALLVLCLAGCDDVTMTVTQTPFFLHEQGLAAHTARDDNTYPMTFDNDLARQRAGCQQATMDLAGFDFQMRYDKDESPFADGLPDDDEVFIQAVNVWHESEAHCGARRVMRETAIIEIFHRERNFDVISQHDCNEKYFVTRMEGIVGLLDLDDLDDQTRNRIPNVRNGQNVEVLLHQERVFWVGDAPGQWSTTLNQHMTEADIRRINQVRHQIDADQTIRWELDYAFDGCNNPPNPFATTCGNRHCWRLEWSDSDVQNAVRTDNQDNDDRR